MTIGAWRAARRDGQRDSRAPVRSLGSARLTAGWPGGVNPVPLREHLERYGPLPLGTDSGNGQPGGAATLTEAVTQAGLTGRGGAGFPTGIKMRGVARRRGPAVVVANGMESEPASHKDHALLSRAPHLILDGAELAAAAVGADAVHLCLPRTKAGLVDRMRAAVADRQRSGLGRIPVQVHALPQHYVSSEATSLVRWLNGGEARPLGDRQRPAQRGVRRRPTLVDNVETLAHIALIARYGPAWFRQAGHPDAPGTMLTTISGAVARPGVYEIEVGTAIADLLAASQADDDVQAVLIGGYFGTWHETGAAADLPMSAQLRQRAGASPGAGVLVALPRAACGLSETARVLGYLAGQSAGQCGPCAFGLPAIAVDFAQLAAGHAGEDALRRLERRLRVLPGRGACRHPDGAAGLAASALATFAGDVSAHASHLPCAAAQQTTAAVLPVPQRPAEGEWR